MRGEKNLSINDKCFNIILGRGNRACSFRVDPGIGQFLVALCYDVSLRGSYSWE